MPGYPHGFILFFILGLLNLLESYILYVTIKVMRLSCCAYRYTGALLRPAAPSTVRPP